MKRPPSSSCLARAAVPAAALVCALSLVPAVLSAGGQDEGGGSAPAIWDGVYTSEQAARGRRAYVENCARCHGAELEGGEYRALTGDRFWASWQEATVGEMLEQISTTMPFTGDGGPGGSLSMRTYVDLVALILSANEFPSGSHELTEASSASVRIVQQGGSGELPAGSFVHVVGCLAPRVNGNWRLVRASRPARVGSDAVDDLQAPLGDREFALMFVITPLDAYVGHRMTVRGSLMGDGGADGVNVTSVASVSDTCD